MKPMPALSGAFGDVDRLASHGMEYPEQTEPRRSRAQVGPDLGERRNLSLRSFEDPSPRSTRLTPRPRRCPGRFTWAPSSGMCRPTHTPATGAWQARKCSTRWGGTTTGCRPERRVQNYYGVLCDPSLRYDPDFDPPATAFDPPVHISRRNFVELCHLLTSEDEKVFERLWRVLGLSVDWAQTYATIDDHSQRTSQRAFLRNLERGEAYAREAPVLWDVDFRSAVAQAELEDREDQGMYHKIAFSVDGSPLFVDTTRPELLCSCVALVAHPDDERYKHLLGANCDHATVRAGGPDSRARARRTGKGNRRRHGLHVRRHHRRGLVEGAAPADPHGHPARWEIPDRDPRVARGGWSRGIRVDSRALSQASEAEDRRATRRGGRDGRRASPHHPCGQVLREGGAAARDRLQPPVVHPQRRNRPGVTGRIAEARGRAAVGTGVHGSALPALGGRPQQRLAHFQAAVLWSPDASLVPAGGGRHRCLRPAASFRTTINFPSIQLPTLLRDTTNRSGTNQAVSSRTPM